MADGTIHVKIRACARFKILARVVRVSKFRQLTRQFGKGVGDKSDMPQCAQLIIFHTAIIMHLVHLAIAEAENEIGGTAVAGTAFRAAWITPSLLTDAARSAPILDGEFFFFPFGRYQRRVGLSFVPLIRIAGPLPSLSQHDPRFDPLARRGITCLEFKGKSLDQDASVRGAPTG